MSFEILDIDGSEIEEKYCLTKLAAKMIKASNLDEDKIKELLNPGSLTTSQAMCVRQACQRIIDAKNHNEKIFVGGDYDADGICSTAIMKKTLDILHIPNGYYIPDRIKEGYGLSCNTVKLAYDKGYRVIITVDNGVKAHDALKLAHELGMYVIVTDHHVIEEEVEADIVVHPDYMEEQYSTLSGAGVALEISRNLIGNQDDLTVFACVAAIGDVMPLWRETRRIVSAGLSILQKGKPRSVCSLFQYGSEIDETSIAFQVVPKLNAVARMNDLSNVNTVVRFLLNENPSVISDYSKQIAQVNQARKNLSASMLKKAEKMVNDESFLILYDESFHTGISGLVAGKIANTYHKPTIVLADHNELITGSARSVDGFNMYDFFQSFTYLKAFGGHEMAAGLSIDKNDLDRFQDEVRIKMENLHFEYEEPVEKAVRIDADDLSIENITGLSVLAPWPKDLIQPEFAVSDLQLENEMIRPKINKYHFMNQYGGFDALVFPGSNLNVPKKIGTVIGKPGLNRWQGKISCQLIVDDIF